MTTRPASEVSREYDCAICLSTPEGQVHQCRNGHLFCAECLTEHRNKHRGTQCPTCRVALPSEPIRNLVAENAIARQPTVCAFCSLNTTVGEARTSAGARSGRCCVAAGDGCMWNGLVVGERAAHEKACTFAICRKMLEPLKCELAESARVRGAPVAARGAAGVHLPRRRHPRHRRRPLAHVQRRGDLRDGGLAALALKGGKWYYEVTILEDCEYPQFGWARQGFAAGAGDGCGDDERSYACDGHRCKLWHASEFQDWLEDEDAKWEPGDVVGCLLDLDQGQIHFSVNGDYDEDEPAFVDVPVLSGYFPCLTMKGGLVKVNFGARDFARFKPHGDDGPEVQGPPGGYNAVAHHDMYEYDLARSSWFIPVAPGAGSASAAAPPPGAGSCAPGASTAAAPRRAPPRASPRVGTSGVAALGPPKPARGAGTSETRAPRRRGPPKPGRRRGARRADARERVPDRGRGRRRAAPHGGTRARDAGAAGAARAAAPRRGLRVGRAGAGRRGLHAFRGGDGGAPRRGGGGAGAEGLGELTQGPAGSRPLCVPSSSATAQGS
ncbi:hypothetical protein JL720_6848 [Aureococcus anophagefferens]|nr:hypothetical protein JL720_6848 [Aureococcus anophagefferens]